MRQYTEIGTGQTFNMLLHPITHQHTLTSVETGEEVKTGFFALAAFCPKVYRFKDGKEITLNAGQFFRVEKEGIPTHERFIVQAKFKRIKA